MNRSKKLFLLDAMALIYRAHFAFIRNPRYNSNGLNTSAVFGFTNSLLEILEKEKPSHIAVVSDSDKPTFRHESFKEYKAQREEMPEAIIEARPYIEGIIKAFGIPYIIKDGFEADDIIGTLAGKAAKEGFDVYMMTPDKDFCQLVDEKVFLYKPGIKGKSARVLNREAVLKEWNIQNVDQVRDILGLMGDASDNIPGVPGIGEKRAKELISNFQSIENLLENLDQLKGKVKETLEENKEQAIQSKELVTIDVNVPVELNIDSLKYTGPDTAKLEALLNELEFRTIGKRVLGNAFRLTGNAGNSNDDSESNNDNQNTSKATLDASNVQYHLLKDEKSILELGNKLNACDHFSIDTETTGVDPHRCRLVGISIAMKEKEAFYLPFSGTTVKNDIIKDALKPALENPSIEKSGHNIKYDLLVLAWHGIDVKGPLFDTMLAHFLIDPETRHNLNFLSERYLDYTPVSIEKLIGKKGKDQKNMEDLEPEDIVNYACEDADITFRLAGIFKEKLQNQNTDKLYREIEGPVIEVLSDMEKNGVYLNQDALKDMSKALADEIKQLEKTLFEMAGKPFNLNSPKQLGEILFEDLKLDPNAKRLPKSKQYSTSEDVLTKLANKHEIAARILDYRSSQKLKSTYVDALPKLIHPKTGRLHTTFNQAVAATGRLSSTNPNLQNIPIRTEKGREIRKAFAVQKSENLLLCADYSQIELRLMADFSEDASMMEAFNKNLDIHAATASKIYGVSLEEVTGDMRRNAKTVNFGIIYGISAFGLSERLNIPRGEAATIIDEYFRQYPKVREYMDSQIEFARENEFVQTKMERKRYLKDINSRNHTTRGYAERNAINTPIQGTAAEMIKIAMINIHQKLKETNLKAKMILQVHDELIFETPESEIDKLKPIVVEKMQNALKLKVPVVVDTGTGKDWLQAH